VQIHSLANGPEVQKPLMETSRKVGTSRQTALPHSTTGTSLWEASGRFPRGELRPKNWPIIGVDRGDRSWLQASEALDHNSTRNAKGF
jgi:hypothetical protein